ncbi:magnesium/cobalt transporter CorA [Tenuifilum thalassicum]|uniref:Magnesium transport protein CorA n=1 Tax=Tenuifilum thalassicum TaxID=2590900 RepID=A0A7D3XYK2_9BACT|nr:magnesium/cobalt transporter CorA [Tenuifilum thalassicum]QKG79253.1 magnesium/cobalt transporter CorA [Tenuifilum thalassicum]
MEQLKFKNIAHKKGQPPGTLIYTGNKTDDYEIAVINYNSEEYCEHELNDIEECLPFIDSPKVSWINIVGLHKVDVIEKIGRFFNLHLLVLEDILNVNQRPKVEYSDEYLFVVLRMLTYNELSHQVDSEQVSMVLGKNFVFTFQERKVDVFEPIRHRIRNKTGLIVKNKADYLLYALIDIIVDNYFVILEKIGEEVEILEEDVLLNPSQEVVHTIHRLKRNLLELRKSIWPLREVLNVLNKDETSVINRNTAIYFRDIHDHTIQVIDIVETLRDMVAGLLDVYLSSVSNRMNEIMKVLTIIATIFIPLTFIAGVYGMNFKYMPELNWRFGYPMSVALMLIVGILMVIYFRRKKWL